MALSWNQVGSLKGPQGQRGETGPQGEKGGSVRIATVDVTDNSDVAFSALTPSDGVKVGDVVLDAMGQAYAVVSVNAGASTAHVGTAVPGYTAKGPKGDVGPAPRAAPRRWVRSTSTPRPATCTRTRPRGFLHGLDEDRQPQGPDGGQPARRGLRRRPPRPSSPPTRSGRSTWRPRARTRARPTEARG